MLCHAKSFLCSVTLYLLVWTPYLLASWSHGPDMDLVLHSVADSTPSFCLDGTPQAFYARRGHGSGEHKWLIFFEGGGWCYDMEQCYLRSKTESGSSRRHPPHRSSPHCLSGEAHLNPLLYNWNMIFVEYCDGSSFAGDAVRTYKDTTLQFKGKRNREAVISTLMDFDLRSHPCSRTGCNTTVEHTITLAHASEVVIAGSSAGALGVLLGIDQMAHQLRQEAASRGNHNIAIHGLVDSGFFLDYSSDFAAQMTHQPMPGQDEAITEKTMGLNGNSNIDYAKAMRDVFVFANIAAGANPACIHAHRTAAGTGANANASHASTRESDCIFAANLLPHIKTPVFLIQPRFDSWQILHIHSQAFTAPGVNEYGARLLEQLQYALFEGFTAGHGAFVDSCTHHGLYGCLGGHENAWSGRKVLSSNSVDATQLHKYGVERKDGGEEQTRWNAAEAFARWYQHSLQVREPVRGMVPGLNWYLQDQRFPCTDCCVCSSRIAGQFAPLKVHRQHTP